MASTPDSILILGATSDLAAAMSRKWAAAGYDLLLCARDTDALQKQAADLKIRYGVSVDCYRFDAAHPEEFEVFLDRLPHLPKVTVAAFGQLADERTRENEAKLLEMIQVNYVGAVVILQKIANRYMARKSGDLIGISSVAGDRGRGENYWYGSSKAGLTAFLSGLRNVCDEKGVHVLTVLPGVIDTKMSRGVKFPPFLMASPERVASDIFNAWKKKQNVLYTPWFWYWIMLFIRILPEAVFKKLRRKT